MVEKNPITPEGIIKLREELHHLRSVERPRIVQMIAVAREHGDLKENAEYHSAKERQSFTEGRINALEDKIARAEVIDPSKLSGDRVSFGATITLSSDGGKETIYQIVGADESDVAAGKLSITSPVARQLIGKEAGDEITIRTPAGARTYEIISVDFK